MEDNQEPVAAALVAGDRGDAVRAAVHAQRDRGAAGQGRRRDVGDARASTSGRAAWRALMPFMLRAADAPPARRGARRPGARRSSHEPPRAGLPRAGASRAPGRRCPSTPRRSCGPSSGVERRAWSRRPVALEDVPAGARPRCPTALRERLRAIAPVRDDREMRVLRAAGQVLPRPARAAGGGRATARRTRWWRRGRATRSSRCCRPATRRTSPSCRSAAGRRWSAASRRERGGREALVVARPRPRSTRVEVDAPLAAGPRQAGHPAAGGSTAPWRAHGLTLGHFPQSYEWATVGGCVATRSAGQASTGFGRIEENVVALRAGRAGGRPCRRARCPRRAAGPLTARAADRLRGRARRHHRGVAARAPARARAPLRGLLRAVASRRARSCCAALAAGRAARRTSPGSPTRRRRASSLALAGRERLGKVARPARPCLLICGWEGDVGAAGGAARRRLRALRALPLGARPGARGWRRATPARTCATTCSTAACSWRRSRPRRPGRGSTG